MKAATQSQDYSIQPIVNNAGLIAEKTNVLVITNLSWKIIHPVNIEPHLDRHRILEQYVDSLLYLCNNLCRQEINFRTLKDRIELARKMLRQTTSALTPVRPKVKRAIFSLLDPLYKILYGTLTENDGTRIMKAIEDARNDTGAVAKLLSELTTVIQTDIEHSYNDIRNLSTRITSLQTTNKKITLQRNFDLAYQELMHAVTQFEINTNTLVNAILTASHGNYHPELFPEEILEKAEHSISNTIKEADFPFKHDKLSLMEIFSISEVKIFIYHTSLIYEIEIPLIDYTNFTLFKLHILPKIQYSNNSEVFQAYIEPESDYIALSASKEHFIPFLREDINACRKVRDTYICGKTAPISEVAETQNCAAKITANLPIATNACDIRIFRGTSTYWSRLLDNAWIFSAPKNDVIYLTCQGRPLKTIRISNAGIFGLRPHCIARSKAAIFSTHHSTITQTPIQNYTNPSLDISATLLKSLKKMDVADLDEILQNETFIYNDTILHNPRAIMGAKLEEIVVRAKELEKFKKYKDYVGYYNETYPIEAILAALWFFCPMALVLVWKIYTCRKKTTAL